MRNKLREKEHKKIVHYMRRVNKQIINDEYLGLNRFRLDMLRENWREYDDKSGGHLNILFKITDNVTGNKAVFGCTNYGFEWCINNYANDFMIRSSNGLAGHFPHLEYYAYDVYSVVPYGNNNVTNPEKYEDDVICKYDWIDLGW